LLPDRAAEALRLHVVAMLRNVVAGYGNRQATCELLIVNAKPDFDSSEYISGVDADLGA
jgi:hypothetical protein